MKLIFESLSLVKINNVIWDSKFYPRYTPKEMLDLGVFGGTYLNSVRDKYPKEWFNGNKVLNPGNKPDYSLNLYKIKSGLSLSEWENNKWILTDNLGWFEWYCNYYLGRRLPEDEVQINRWRNFCNRFSASIHSNNKDTHNDALKQALLQWSFNWEDTFKECQSSNMTKLITSSTKEYSINKNYLFK
ncbi:MAG: hypothetical protein ACRCXT_00780 [Paraclostridium sp.]